MPSDRRLIELDKAALRRQYTGPAQTSGALVTGKIYRLTNPVSGDDFTNVGAATNSKGRIFAATGDTPTTWTNGSQVNGLLLADLQAIANQMLDKSPSDVEVTSTSYEGSLTSGQLTDRRQLRRIALEELIEEWDPAFVPSLPARGTLLIFEPGCQPC